MRAESELSPAERAAVAEVVGAPGVFCWVASLTGRLRSQVEHEVRVWTTAMAIGRWLDGLKAAGHTEATLGGLADGGWLDPWNLPRSRGGLAYTLTPGAAVVLGVVVRELWVYDRIGIAEYRGADKPPAKVTRRRYSEEPRWGADPTTPIVLPPSEFSGEALAEWAAADGLTPDEDVTVAEAGRLYAEFERLAGLDLDEAMEALDRAVSIVPGIAGEVRARWLWDAATDRPWVVRGELVPRERRRSRAG